MTGDELTVLDNVLNVLDRLVYLLDDEVHTDEPSERTIAERDISEARARMGDLRAAHYTRFGPNH